MNDTEGATKQKSLGVALDISARDIFYVLFKRKWSIFFIIAATLFAAVIWLFLIREDLYVVSAKVLVKIGQEQTAPPAVLGGSPPLVVGYRHTEVNSEVQILNNTELIGRVIDRLGLDQPGDPPPVPERFIPRLRYEARRFVRSIKDTFNEILIKAGLRERLTQREAVLDTLTKGLNIEPLRESSVFVAALITPYRQGSSVVLNTLLEEYQKFRIQLYQDRSANFFETEVEDAANELAQTDRELQRYEAKWDINALDKQQSVQQEQIAVARRILDDARVRFDESQSKVDRLDRELQTTDPNFGALGEFKTDSFPQTVMVQIAALQRERERLRMTELDTGERLQNNRSQFQALVAMLSANLRATRDEYRAQFESRVEILEALDNEATLLHDKQMNWITLKRKIGELEGRYQFYRSKLEEAVATSTLKNQNITNVVIVERASDPIVPAGIRKLTLLGLAGLFGVLAALAWVAVAEFFDHRIYHSDQLEALLGAPVIATVPKDRDVLEGSSL